MLQAPTISVKRNAGLRNRLWNYRYTFNGMEADDEVSGTGNSYDFGDRMYNPRVGRWIKPDAYQSKYPQFSTYSFAINSPILIVDKDGNDIIIVDPETGDKHLYVPGQKIPQGASQFVIDTYLGLDYLQHSAGQKNADIINQLVDDSEYKVEILYEPMMEETAFEPNIEIDGYIPPQMDSDVNGQVSWNNKEGTFVGQVGADGHNKKSPVALLGHEMNHASQYQDIYNYYKNALEFDPDKFEQDVQSFLDGGGQKCLFYENDIVFGSELELAFEKGEGYRINYGDVGDSFITSGPFSTDVIMTTTQMSETLNAVPEILNTINENQAQ